MNHRDHHEQTRIERGLRRIDRKLDFLLIYMLEGLPTKQQIQEIMSQLTEQAARWNAKLDGIEKTVDAISEDQKFQAEQIAKLQASQGPWTAEDQSTLDALEARTNTLGERLVAVDAAVAERPPTPQ